MAHWQRLNPDKQLACCSSYEPGPALIRPAQRITSGTWLYVEFEYSAVRNDGGRIPILFTGHVSAERMRSPPRNGEGTPMWDWRQAFDESLQSAERPLPTGEHCLDWLGRHLEFQSLTRSAVERALRLEGASDFRHLIRALEALPDDQIDLSETPETLDRSNPVRGTALVGTQSSSFR